MDTPNKSIERNIKYEIYIYDKITEIDKHHYIKIDGNVTLIHVLKLLNILHIIDNLKISFLHYDEIHGYDEIGYSFLETMTPNILKKIYNNLYTSQNIIIFTI